MSDFVPRAIRETPTDFGTWSKRLLGCANKLHFTRRQTRMFVARDKVAFPWRDFEAYHCKWCNTWHMAEMHDPQKERKRRKFIRDMRREKWFTGFTAGARRA